MHKRGVRGGQGESDAISARALCTEQRLICTAKPSLTAFATMQLSHANRNAEMDIGIETVRINAFAQFFGD